METIWFGPWFGVSFLISAKGGTTPPDFFPSGGTPVANNAPIEYKMAA